MTNEVLHGQCAVEEDAEAFVRVNERTVVSSSNGVGGNEGKFLSCFDEHCSCLFTILLKFVLCHPAFDIVMCHQVLMSE